MNPWNTRPFRVILSIHVFTHPKAHQVILPKHASMHPQAIRVVLPVSLLTRNVVIESTQTSKKNLKDSGKSLEHKALSGYIPHPYTYSLIPKAIRAIPPKPVSTHRHVIQVITPKHASMHPQAIRVVLPVSLLTCNVANESTQTSKNNSGDSE